MTDKTLHISKIVKKTSDKTGNDYWSLDTNQGKMTVFDNQVIEDLESKEIPGDFRVDVVEKGNFKNIVEVFLDEEVEPKPEVIRPFDQTDQAEQPQVSKELDEDEKRFVSMCISYAKDLAMVDKIKLGSIRTWAYDFLNLYREMIGKPK